MVTLELHDPSAAIEVKQPHARRLATLEGKRIGLRRASGSTGSSAVPLSRGTTRSARFPRLVA